MKKKNLATILTILIIVAIIIFVKFYNPKITDEETSRCIGENSVLYVQLGCHACETQTELFGENKKYLNEIDCFYNKDKCGEIQYTPTWVINNEKYIGVRSIEELKSLTGC